MIHLPGTGCVSGREARGIALSVSDTHSLNAAAEQSLERLRAGPVLEPQLWAEEDTQPRALGGSLGSTRRPQPSGSQSAA